MLQIWFISVILNILGGFLLSFDSLAKKFNFLNSTKAFFDFFTSNNEIKKILGMVFLAVGVLELIMPYGNILIIGDLLTALSLILLGFIFFLKDNQQLNPKVLQENKNYSVFKNFVEGKTVPIGFFCIIVGILHFLIPYANFI